MEKYIYTTLNVRILLVKICPGQKIKGLFCTCSLVEKEVIELNKELYTLIKRVFSSRNALRLITFHLSC